MAKKKTVIQTTSFDKKKKKTIPIEKGRWGGHVFIVSSKLIRGFSDLSIEGSSETEEKEKKEQKHVSRKRGNPIDVSLTITLNAFTGCNVRKEALEFVSEARKGKTDYFYVGGKKLVSCKLMLTNASVQEVEISPGGTWTSAKVSLSMKQYDTGGTAVNDSGSGGSSGGGSSGGGGGGSAGSAGAGSAKYSVNTSSPKTTSTTSLSSIANTVKQGAATINQAKQVLSGQKSLSEATKYIADMAKKQTAPAKPSVVKSQRLDKLSLTK